MPTLVDTADRGRHLRIMSRSSALTLDHWPPPPPVSFPVPKKPANDTVAGLLDRGLDVVGAAEDLRLALERHLASVKSSLERLCRKAERSEPRVDDINTVIALLLRQEKVRAKEALPVLDMIRVSRKKFGKSKANARYRFFLAWNKEISPIEDALVAELEALRDARLRLEARRAASINEGKEDGPVFTSGTAAVAYLRTLRK